VRRGPGGVLYISGTHMGYVLPEDWERDISSDPTFLANMRAAQEKNKGFNFFIVHKPESQDVTNVTEVNVYMLTREEALARVDNLRSRIVEDAA